jgi:hypothetical protein
MLSHAPISLETLARLSEDRHSENLRRMADLERQIISVNMRLWVVLIGIIGILVQGLHSFFH